MLKSYNTDKNQYRSNSNDVVLLDYEASVSPSSNYLGPISTYYLDSGSGRSLVFGIFTDLLQSNPVFLSFFDQIFRIMQSIVQQHLLQEIPGQPSPVLDYLLPRMIPNLNWRTRYERRWDCPKSPVDD